MVEINKFIDELKSYKLDVDNRFIFFAPIDNLTLELTIHVVNQ